MNKNINTVVELTEKELECVAAGMKVSRVLEGVMMLGTIAVRPDRVQMGLIGR